MTTYFAEHLDGPSQFLILAEDITLRGAEVPDAVAGLSVEQVDELLTTLSQVHAPFWDSPRLRRRWRPVLAAAPDHRRSSRSSCAPTGSPSSGCSSNCPTRRRFSTRRARTRTRWRRRFGSCRSIVAAAPMTLLHGDPHPRNTYSLPDGRMGVLDWQLVRRGSWVHDVGYALIGALPPELRRNHERELLDNYRGRSARRGCRRARSRADVDRLPAQPGVGFLHVGHHAGPDVLRRDRRDGAGPVRRGLLGPRHRRAAAVTPPLARST